MQLPNGVRLCMETRIEVENGARVPAAQVHLLLNEVMSVAAKYGVNMNIVRCSGVIK